MNLRPATAADFSAILALNEQSVQFLSPLSAQRLAQLHASSALHCGAERDGRVIAFLLAFREGADYDSINYVWFAQRYRRFLYIDRVVVALDSRAHGTGSALYAHAFGHAAQTGVPVLACEFDLEPANLVSERFHSKFGFREVGRQSVAGGRKRVSLQTADVGLGPAA